MRLASWTRFNYKHLAKADGVTPAAYSVEQWQQNAA
jgi:hypothetical protein